MTDEKNNDSVSETPVETTPETAAAPEATSDDPAAKKKRPARKRAPRKKRVAKTAADDVQSTDGAALGADASADAAEASADADEPRDKIKKKVAAKKRASKAPAKKRPRRAAKKGDAAPSEPEVHPAFFPAVGDDGPHPAFLPAMSEDEPDEEEGETPDIATDRIDADALWVVRRLRAKGHEAYLTGGCVRDLLLDREPKDFDVATAAHPDEVKRVFRNCRLVGRRFRLAHVIFAGGKVIETATFRKSPNLSEPSDEEDNDIDSDVDTDDGDTNEGGETRGRGRRGARASQDDDNQDDERRDDEESDRDDDDDNNNDSDDSNDSEGSSDDLLVERDNEFGNVQEDAVRRDFTINGLFYDPVAGKILDYVNGREDVDKRIIRTIGDADIRFQEDPVRILRAIKFAARLGFSIEAEADAAMKRHAPELLRCAPARLLDEVMRLFVSGHAVKSYELLERYGVLDVLLPEIKEALERELKAPVVVVPEPEAATSTEDTAAPAEDAPAAPTRKTIDIESFDGGGDDDDDDVVGIAAQLSSDDEAKKPARARREREPQDEAPAVMPTPPREPPKSPKERRELLLQVLGVVDEIHQRGADISSAIALGALLWPAYEALVAAGEDAMRYVDDLGNVWAERIRMTRRDRETVRVLLAAQDSLHPGWRHGGKAKTLVGRPWFREALMLRIIIGRATGADLSDIPKWKAIASNHNKSYRQPKKGERIQRPRRSRRSRSGGGGGGRSGGRGRGGGRRRN